MGKQVALTPKQEKFCHAYLESGSASEAYRVAYNAENMKPETVNRRAYELLENGKITARLEVLKARLTAKSDITKEQVLEEYAKIAFSSIAHLHNTWIDRKSFSELTDEQKACIKNISTKVRKVPIGEETFAEVEFVKIELYDKLKALDSISQMLGFNAPVKTDITTDGKPIGSLDVNVVFTDMSKKNGRKL